MEMRDRRLDALMILLVAVVWLYLLVHSLRLEERGTVFKGYTLDNSGEVVQVHGRVWEAGKGERPATQEEEEYALDRAEGEQR